MTNVIRTGTMDVMIFSAAIRFDSIVLRHRKWTDNQQTVAAADSILVYSQRSHSAHKQLDISSPRWSKLQTGNPDSELWGVQRCGRDRPIRSPAKTPNTKTKPTRQLSRGRKDWDANLCEQEEITRPFFFLVKSYLHFFFLTLNNFDRVLHQSCARCQSPENQYLNTRQLSLQLERKWRAQLLGKKKSQLSTFWLTVVTTKNKGMINKQGKKTE